MAARPPPPDNNNNNNNNQKKKHPLKKHPPNTPPPKKTKGEEGIDAGGVKKEFFQLLVAELLSPDYGMLVYQPESHTYWFNACSLEGEEQFMLLGLVLGLAIYNRVLLDFPLPLALYKKLLGQVCVCCWVCFCCCFFVCLCVCVLCSFSIITYLEQKKFTKNTPPQKQPTKKHTNTQKNKTKPNKQSVGLRDLEEMQPMLGRSLRQLLRYEGPDSCEDAFCLTFSVEMDYFGDVRTVALKPGGEELPVTEENRHEYVELMVDYLLNRCVEECCVVFDLIS